MGMVKCMPRPLNPFETVHWTFRRVDLRSLSEYSDEVKPRDGNPVVAHTVEYTTPKKKNYTVKRVMIFLMLHSIIIRPSNNYSILDDINYNYNFNTYVVFHVYANNRRGSTNKQNHIVTARRTPNHSSVNPRTKSRGGLPQICLVSSSNITLENCTQNPRPL